jgi:hypothetical protein
MTCYHYLMDKYFQIIKEQIRKNFYEGKKIIILLLYGNILTKLLHIIINIILLNFFLSCSLVAINFTYKVDKWNDRGSNPGTLHI